MRSVMTVVVVVGLLAIWLITQYPDDRGPNEALTAREAMPVTIAPEPSLPPADREEIEASIPDEVTSDNAAITDTIPESDFDSISGSAVRTSVIEFDPEQRVQIVDYLSENGLAVVDSERIADAALERVGECVEQAFRGSNGATSNLIETCMFDIFADYGLGEIAVTD